MTDRMKGWLLACAQSDFLSFPASPLDKTSPRARSHGDNVAALVDAASAEAAAEPRSKSETDLGAGAAGSSRAAPPPEQQQPPLPHLKAVADPNDPRFVEREVRGSCALPWHPPSAFCNPEERLLSPEISL